MTLKSTVAVKVELTSNEVEALRTVQTILGSFRTKLNECNGEYFYANDIEEINDGNLADALCLLEDISVINNEIIEIA